MQHRSMGRAVVLPSQGRRQNDQVVHLQKGTGFDQPRKQARHHESFQYILVHGESRIQRMSHARAPGLVVQALSTIYNYRELSSLVCQSSRRRDDSRKISITNTTDRPHRTYCIGYHCATPVKGQSGSQVW